MDERRIVERAGLVLPAAVWILGVVSLPRDGLTPTSSSRTPPCLSR
jgi:hypothetical protein